MSGEHELTIRIEETDAGEYRARLARAPDEHYAKCDDPVVAVRGALAVARDAVDSAVGFDRTPDTGEAVSD